MNTRNLKFLGFVFLAIGMTFSLFAFGCSARKSKPTQLRIHPVNWVSKHPDFIFSNNLQPEYGQACKSCHGEDFSGGTAGVSCVDCHNQRRDSTLRLIVCTGCHGGGLNPIDSTFDTTGAPPYSLVHGSLFSDRGVGGHPAMVKGSSLFAGTDCQTCHVKPAFVLSPSHFTPSGSGADGRAEVIFSGMAQLFSSQYGTPVFDTFRTCANVYCHGAFPGGNQWRPYFYGGSGEAFCGSCHSAKTGNNFTQLGGRHRTHNPDSLGIQCTICHFATVVSPDSINLSAGKHVNGSFDVVFDPSIAPNAVFNPATRSCDGVPGAPCHVTTPADTLWDN